MPSDEPGKYDGVMCTAAYNKDSTYNSNPAVYSYMAANSLERAPREWSNGSLDNPYAPVWWNADGDDP